MKKKWGSLSPFYYESSLLTYFLECQGFKKDYIFLNQLFQNTKSFGYFCNKRHFSLSKNSVRSALGSSLKRVKQTKTVNQHSIYDLLQNQHPIINSEIIPINISQSKSSGHFSSNKSLFKHLP